MGKVIHVIDDLRVGGAQRLLVTFAEEARKNDETTTIISLRDDVESPIPQQLNDLGVTVLAAAPRDRGRLLDFERWRRLVRALRSSAGDTVQTHLTYANILGVLAAKAARKHVIATLHCVVNEEHGLTLRAAIRKWLEYSVLRLFADNVIGVGQLVVDSHQPHLGKKTIISIPNAVQPVRVITPEERSRIRTEIMGCDRRPVLLSLGRYHPQKGFHDLLQAFAKVHVLRPDIALVIAGGDGGLLGDLRREASTLGLDGHAFLLEARGDVEGLLGAADVYVCSSHYEGLPLSMLEAMSIGLPVIATDVGSISEVITEQSGILIPAKDIDKLACAITSIFQWQDKWPAMGLEAQRILKADFDVSVWYQRWTALYR